MARTVIQGRTALVLGVDTALGRACGQQLSRAGCRVVLAGHNQKRLDDLAAQIVKKGGEPSVAALPKDMAEWKDPILDARDEAGHLHFVVNATAYDPGSETTTPAGLERARRADELCAELLVEHGPTKMLTLWPADQEVPPPIRPEAWHGYIVLGPVQTRDDTPLAARMPGGGPVLLRAGAVGDAVVFLLQLPPSARPARIYLDGLAVQDRKGEP